MSLLLDTHVVVWFTEDSPRLPERLKSKIENDYETIFVSIASIWEIAIKVSIGKMQLSMPLDNWVEQLFEPGRFILLPINLDHIQKVATLPFHHKDPFDRLLIAQSLVESIPVVSIDSNFDAYGVERLW